MKKKLILILCEICILILSGCRSNKGQYDGTDTGLSTIDYRVKYIRTDGYHDGEEYPKFFGSLLSRNFTNIMKQSEIGAIGLVFGFIYAFNGYKKDAAKYYKMFMYTYAINSIFAVINQTTDHLKYYLYRLFQALLFLSIYVY